MSERTIDLKYAVTRVDSGVLEMVYRVENGLESAIYLMTPLSDIGDDGAAAAALGRAYAFLDPDGVLQITKQLWPLPDDMDVIIPEVPFLTKVQPGESFEEVITAAIPVRIDYPYRLEGVPEEADGVEGPAMIMVEARGLAFSIGYVVEGEVPSPMDARGAGGAVRFEVSYGAVAGVQQILQGAALNLRVPVQDVNEV